MSAWGVASVAIGVSLMLAAPVVAHTGLSTSQPAAGATLARLPARITLTFQDFVTAPRVRVRDRTGRNVAVRVRTDPRSARRVQVTTRPGARGTYHVRWQVTSLDGHRLRGAFRFRVR